MSVRTTTAYGIGFATKSAGTRLTPSTHARNAGEITPVVLRSVLQSSARSRTKIGS